MTSNQLDYWRNKETERANRFKEAETMRHNIQEERLEQRKLTLEEQRVLAALAEMYAKYGWSDMQQLPEDLAYQLGGSFGYQPYNLDSRSGLPAFWHEIKSSAGNIGKMIGSLF